MPPVASIGGPGRTVADGLGEAVASLAVGVGVGTGAPATVKENSPDTGWPSPETTFQTTE